MKLDLSSLEKALKSLQRAVDRSQKAKEDEELRDAVIQRFEYSYELSWKMMKRMLEQESVNPSEIDTLSFRDLLREAAEKGFIQEIEPWFEYREARNRTSHTYDEESAKEVYESALRFFPEANALLEKLKQRNL